MATISRRGALGMVAASSLALLGLSVGQTIGGATRSTALLAPRGQIREKARQIPTRTSR